MADTSDPKLVYIDDIIGEKGMKMIEHDDGWPSKGLWFSAVANASYYLQQLREASQEDPEKFSVYTKATIPGRYHFSHSERIAPIYVVPKLGHLLTNRSEDPDFLGKGVRIPRNYVTRISCGISDAYPSFVHRTTGTTMNAWKCKQCLSLTVLLPLI